MFKNKAIALNVLVPLPKEELHKYLNDAIFISVFFLKTQLIPIIVQFFFFLPNSWIPHRVFGSSFCERTTVVVVNVNSILKFITKDKPKHY